MDQDGALMMRFEAGSATVDQLQDEIDQALQSTPADDARSPASAEVSQEAMGFGLELIVVALLISGGKHVAQQVWDDLIWPRVTSRLGADALGEQKADEVTDKPS